MYKPTLIFRKADVIFWWIAGIRKIKNKQPQQNKQINKKQLFK